MKKNIGTIDKIVRIILVLVIVALYFTHVIYGVLAIVLLVFAGILLLTSLISFCPLYLPFGIKTTKKKKE